MGNQGLNDQGKEHEQEGVIKYDLSFVNRPISSSINIAPLDKWRHVLFNLALIGQDPERYGGLGFGNLSNRLPCSITGLETDDSYLNSQHLSENSFLISGSQTGHLPYLMRKHYSVVTHCSPSLNQLTAYGGTQPSSESLTHGVLYNELPSIGAVVHVHSPIIWNLVDALALPATEPCIRYGTPDMAKAVVDIANDISANAIEPVFVMKGHVDGVVSFGPDLLSAVTSLLGVYHAAIMKTVR